MSDVWSRSVPDRAAATFGLAMALSLSALGLSGCGGSGAAPPKPEAAPIAAAPPAAVKAKAGGRSKIVVSEEDTSFRLRRKKAQDVPAPKG